jgi:hypothetical protein
LLRRRISHAINQALTLILLLAYQARVTSAVSGLKQQQRRHFVAVQNISPDREKM